MKIFFTFLVFSLMSLKGTGSNSPKVIPDGVWYNSVFNRTLVIETYRNGMNIRGIHSRSGWTWFRRVAKWSYYDDYGNKLKIYPHKVVYTSFKNNQRLTFFPVDSKHDRINRRPDNMYSNAEKPNHHQGRDIGSDNERNRIDTDNLEGTWKVEGIDKEVYITETREGIKARFKDARQWYDYEFSPPLHAYISPDGNRYELSGKALTWTDKDMRKKFILYKISDELED
jgi:hypothetical protein